MTRKRLSTLVGVLGFFAAAGALVLMLVMGSVFADARTENITGPGVDVFMRTPFPTEGSQIVLDVEARGGKRAGVRSIVVRYDGQELVAKLGPGATWSGSIGGRGRGSDEQTVYFTIPSSVRANTTMPLAIKIGYVVALSKDGGYRNKHFDALVTLDVKVYTPSDRTWAQLGRVALALGCFALWLLAVWGVAKLYAKTDDDFVGHDAAEMEGIGLLMGFIGGSILGYWLFAWRITNALEVRSPLGAVALMVAWCGVPLLWTWLWWRWRDRRQNRSDLPSARVIAR